MKATGQTRGFFFERRMETPRALDETKGFDRVLYLVKEVLK
jgi:hypothetical protein